MLELCPVWKNECSRRGWVTGRLPQNYENKNKKKESEKKPGGDQKEYVALMQTVKLKRHGVGFPACSRESGVGVLSHLVCLVLRSVVPWCTTSLTKNESIGEGGRLKSKFSRLSVRDPKIRKNGKILHSTGGRSPFIHKNNHKAFNKFSHVACPQKSQF